MDFSPKAGKNEKGSKTDPQIGKPVRAVLTADMEAWRDAVIIRVTGSLRYFPMS